MVEMAKRFGSYRKAAKELGFNCQSVTDHCKARGIVFKSTHELSKLKKQKVIDGHTFYWYNKGYYRGQVNGERIMLSDYIYRKVYGSVKPKRTVIMFKDGDHDNYNVENVYFITTSEFCKILDEKNHDRNVKLLEEGRNANIENEKKHPHLKKRRLQRTWTTRRRNDPDNLSCLQGAATRRQKAIERGFFYTPEQRKRMSLAHVGKSVEMVRIQKHEDIKAALRRKMGME